MPHPLAASLMPPLIDRCVLLANHLLRTEPVAAERLLPHAGRSVDISWRAMAGGWPVPPGLRLRITPAGLLERDDASEPPSADRAAALSVCIELPALHRLIAMALAGERPRVEVGGDAQFAADVAWLAENLRWDAERDLARLFGNAPARMAALAAQATAKGLRGLAQGVADTWDRGPGRDAQNDGRRDGAGAASTR